MLGRTRSSFTDFPMAGGAVFWGGVSFWEGNRTQDTPPPNHKKDQPVHLGIPARRSPLPIGVKPDRCLMGNHHFVGVIEIGSEMPIKGGPKCDQNVPRVNP